MYWRKDNKDFEVKASFHFVRTVQKDRTSNDSASKLSEKFADGK